MAQLTGAPLLVVMLLYGAGLRLNESLSLRVKDIDLERRTLMVRSGKGNKDRRSVLPDRLTPLMTDQVAKIRSWHAKELLRGRGYLALPDALGHKFPNAVRDWRWAWLFPSARDVYDRRAKRAVRFPVHQSTIQRAIARAAVKAGLNKRVTAHTFRHSFATQLLRSGYNIRTVQELLGHANVSTTMVYLHVLDQGMGVRSPLDRLAPASPPPLK